jgi:hypothetical protein
VVRADDDLRIWRDAADVPERRFKANAISRSHCGRIAAQWTSADGMHWDGERETLDFDDPWNAPPNPEVLEGSTGRILMEAWAGPEEEDEVHGGYVFRDGDRWLLHYMKWTADGHIYLGLATSNDGLNFSRVNGGAQSTLPLGEAGTWDAGRVAIREAPFLIDGVWRQYYVGCGWKHGMSGMGSNTSHAGIDAPNQIGVAELPAGHWTYSQLSRDAAEGELTTIVLDVKQPSALSLDAEGLEHAGSEIACCVWDETGRVLAGYDYSACDAITENGRAVQVTWRGKGLETAGARALKIGVRVRGWGVKLYGLDLKPGIEIPG